MGGNSFLRIGGLCGGAAKSTVHSMLYDVARQCRRIKPDFLHMPSQQMINDTARVIYHKYKIFNVAGTLLIFFCGILPQARGPSAMTRQSRRPRMPRPWSLFCLGVGVGKDYENFQNLEKQKINRIIHIFSKWNLRIKAKIIITLKYFFLCL